MWATQNFFILGWGSCGGKKEVEANRGSNQPAPVPQQPQATRVSRSSTRAYGCDVGIDLINNVGNDDRPPPLPPGLTTNSTSATEIVTAMTNIPQAVAITRFTASATTIQMNTFIIVLPGYPTRIRFGTLRSINNTIVVISPATHLHLRNRVQTGDIIVSVDIITATNNTKAIRSIGPRSRSVINRLNRSITSTANDGVGNI